MHNRGDRLHATGGDATPDDGQQAHATFILGKDFDGSPCWAMRKLLLEHSGEIGLKLGHGFGLFFAWEGRGRFGLARSFPRTKAYTPEYSKLTP
jgi:hypothetical protein